MSHYQSREHGKFFRRVGNSRRECNDLVNRAFAAEGEGEKAERREREREEVKLRGGDFGLGDDGDGTVAKTESPR